MHQSRAAHSVLGGASLQTVGSMAFWMMMMPLLLVAVISTDSESHHGAYGGSRIVLADAFSTESRSFAGRKMAMAGRGGGRGEGRVLAAGEAFHVSTGEGAGAWSDSDPNHHASIHRPSSKPRFAESTLTPRLRGMPAHGSGRGRLLESFQSSAWLTPHNGPRSDVGVPGLTWNNTVASTAASWASQLAEDCTMYHAANSGYGENLYMAWSSGQINITPSTVVGAWVAEKAYYNYATDTCATGKVCGHYTQVVWKNSKQVGCAIASCKSGSNNVQIAVCRYGPPGNYIGQKPY